MDDGGWIVVVMSIRSKLGKAGRFEFDPLGLCGPDRPFLGSFTYSVCGCLSKRWELEGGFIGLYSGPHLYAVLFNLLVCSE